MATKSGTSKRKSTPTAKSTTSKAPLRGRVAKGSPLSKKVAFNWKIVALIGVVLVLALGFLYVRLSKAAGDVAYRWTPGAQGMSIQADMGSQRNKTNGTAVIDSVGAVEFDPWTRKEIGRKQMISVDIASNVPGDNTYCAAVTGAGSKKTDLKVYPGNPMGIIDSNGNLIYTGGNYSYVNNRETPAGDNSAICFTVPAKAYEKGGKRTINLKISSDKNFFLSEVTRLSGNSTAPAADPIQSQAPAAQNPSQKTTPTPTPVNCAQMTNGRGNQNDCVKFIQQRLKDLGYDPGAVDSIYGEKTTSAVKIFQSKSGLPQDGTVGPNTWAALVSPNAARKS